MESITICNQHGLKFIRRGENAVYVQISDAQEFVNCCIKNGCLILGIDGFIIRGSGIYPIDSLIADFSLETDALKTCDLAKKFLSLDEAAQATHFDFVLERDCGH